MIIKSIRYTSKWVCVIVCCCIFIMWLAGCVATGESAWTERKSMQLPTYKGVKKRIAVVEFDVKTKTYGIKDIDKKVADSLSTALFKSENFILIERDKIKRVLKEQKLSLTGIVDPDTVIKIGNILGVQAIVTGSIIELAFEKTSFIVELITSYATIDVKIIDVSNAMVLMAEEGKGKSSSGGIPVITSGKRGVMGVEKGKEKIINDALSKAVEDVAEKIAKKMLSVPWEGMIARISDRKVFINAGTNVGLHIGELLKVCRRVNQIKDPITHEILGYEKKEVGKLIISNVEKRFSEAIPQNISDFRVGDTVKFITQKEENTK